jgi:hypothetical protein
MPEIGARRRVSTTSILIEEYSHLCMIHGGPGCHKVRQDEYGDDVCCGDGDWFVIERGRTKQRVEAVPVSLYREEQ